MLNTKLNPSAKYQGEIQGSIGFILANVSFALLKQYSIDFFATITVLSVRKILLNKIAAWTTNVSVRR